MKKITLMMLCLPFLSACSPSTPKLPDLSKLMPSFAIPSLYKKDIHQGSILERFKVNQLKVGMSKAQVKDLIGSPSVIDPFHNNQWDYINHSTLHNKADIHYRLTLTFKQNTLTNIDQTGLSSLPKLSPKEITLETQRIAAEKAAEQARAKAKIQRAAQQKAAAKLKALEEKRLAEEMSKAMAIIKAKAERIAREKAAAANAQNNKP